MPRREPLAQGYRLPYEARTGLGSFPPLRGVDKESDPGAIDDNEFAYLENVRINPDGIVESRGGQSPIHTVALSGAVEGIFDAGPLGEPVVVGGSSPSPHKPPPVPPGGIVVVTLNPRGGGFYNPVNNEVNGWSTFIPSLAPWQALRDNNHNTYVGLAGPALTPLTCLVDQIPEVNGATLLNNVIVSVDPLVVGGTDANGFWLTNTLLHFRARLGGVNLDAGPFTPMKDQHTIEHEFLTKPGGGAWTVADINACEFGFMIDLPFSGGGNSQPYIAKLWVDTNYQG